MIDLDARMLAIRCGVGDLERPGRCWGFQHCCDCKDCLERQRLADERALNPPVLRVRFPWEEAA